MPKKVSLTPNERLEQQEKRRAQEREKALRLTRQAIENNIRAFFQCNVLSAYLADACNLLSTALTTARIVAVLEDRGYCTILVDNRARVPASLSNS